MRNFPVDLDPVVAARVSHSQSSVANAAPVQNLVLAGNQEPWRVTLSVVATWRLKRVLDFVGSCVLLILFGPIMLGIAFAIWLIDSGPVLFRWNILGLGGTPIASYKFRTMLPNAEEMESTLRANGWNEMESVYFKARNDPRVTPIGRLLRRFSLDELPSLWSVVKGDMSLVGPRPVRVAEAPYLKPWHAERFSVRPGLTSPWVLSGKGKVRDFDTIAAFDIEYIRHCSVWLDIKMLARTFVYIISGSNY